MGNILKRNSTYFILFHFWQCYIYFCLGPKRQKSNMIMLSIFHCTPEKRKVENVSVVIIIRVFESYHYLCSVILCISEYLLLQVYVEYVVKNPLLKLNEYIQSELFKIKLDSFMKMSPIFLKSV